MSSLPPPSTPLNQHSLAALELWLTSLGASKKKDDPSCWKWFLPDWTAEISMQQDELHIVWTEGEKKSQFSFPYGLSRQDVQAALMQGP